MHRYNHDILHVCRCGREISFQWISTRKTKLNCECTGGLSCTKPLILAVHKTYSVSHTCLWANVGYHIVIHWHFVMMKQKDKKHVLPNSCMLHDSLHQISHYTSDDHMCISHYIWNCIVVALQIMKLFEHFLEQKSSNFFVLYIILKGSICYKPCLVKIMIWQWMI